jgi:hypothetical protein
MTMSKPKNIQEQYVSDSLDSVLDRIKNKIVAGAPEEDARLKWLMDKNYRNGVFEKEPRCIVVIKTISGNDLPLVPVCNRMAAYDDNIVKMGLKLASEFKDNENVDQDHLDNVIGNLKRIIIIKDRAK